MVSSASVAPAFDECHLCGNGFATDRSDVCAATHTVTHVDAGVRGFRSRSFTAPTALRGRHYFGRPISVGGEW
jgi:hypothetical protein